MIDPRIYRAAFLPAAIALVALMFSVEPNPSALRQPRAGLAASEFDDARATRTARQIVETAPEREPGSRGDAAAAELVATRFAAAGAGRVSEQRFEGEWKGEDVTLRNVVLTLPGASDRTIAVVAHRDSARGPGAASSAAATGVLVELAADFAGTRRAKTMVFVSTDGGSDGAAGAREFIDAYPFPERLEAVLVISQPGAADPEGPHVLAWSSGAQSSSAQLVHTAESAVEAQIDRDAGSEGFLAALFRLALPSGLGEQAVLVEQGVDAVAIAGAGERPLEPAADEPRSLAAESVGEFGRAAYSLLIALDQAPEAPAHGPEEHLTLAGNLIPGWALSLLALALVLPAGLTALDGLARASRRGERVGLGLAWAASRALPFAVGLALAYLLTLTGVAPDPEFPFDPGRFEFGWRAAGVLVALSVAFALAVASLRPLAVPLQPDRETLAAASGIVATLAFVGVWILNPYLALLLVPLPHLWVLGARPDRLPLPGAVVGVFVALLPLAVALVYVIERLELGPGALWPLLLALTGGHVPVMLALVGCLLAGTLLCVLALARPAGGRPHTEPPAFAELNPLRKSSYRAD